MVLHSFIDCKSRGCIADNTAYIQRKLSRRDLPACNCLEKLFFISLRVLHLQWLYFNRITKFLGSPIQLFDGIHFVHFHAYDDLFRIHGLGCYHGSFQQFVGILKHQTIVACNVWFAFHTIYYKVFDLFACRDGELYAGGEGCTTHSDYSHFLHKSKNLFLRLALPIIRGCKQIGLLFVTLYYQCICIGSCGQPDLSYIYDASSYRGMDVCRNKGGSLAYDFSLFNPVPFCLQRSGGGT